VLSLGITHSMRDLICKIILGVAHKCDVRHTVDDITAPSVITVP